MFRIPFWEDHTHRDVYHRDVLNGGRGDDTLIGGSGVDDFIFSGLIGFDVVQDWQNNVDHLDFTLVTSITSLSDFTSQSSELDGNVVIQLGGGDVITVLGASIAQFDVGDLIF